MSVQKYSQITKFSKGSRNQVSSPQISLLVPIWDLVCFCFGLGLQSPLFTGVWRTRKRHLAAEAKSQPQSVRVPRAAEDCNRLYIFVLREIYHTCEETSN
jgi:hypothetical protein